MDIETNVKHDFVLRWRRRLRNSRRPWRRSMLSSNRGTKIRHSRTGMGLRKCRMSFFDPFLLLGSPTRVSLTVSPFKSCTSLCRFQQHFCAGCVGKCYYRHSAQYFVSSLVSSVLISSANIEIEFKTPFLTQSSFENCLDASNWMFSHVVNDTCFW